MPISCNIELLVIRQQMKSWSEAGLLKYVSYFVTKSIRYLQALLDIPEIFLVDNFFNQ